MSKLGTCKHAFQIQEVYHFTEAEHQRAQDAPECVDWDRHRVKDTSDEYTCQWLDAAGELPPPIKRMNGGFGIRREDCDNCPRYEAVEVDLMGLLKK